MATTAGHTTGRTDDERATLTVVLCPDCNGERLAEHVDDDVETGIAFKVYRCAGCGGTLTTTELSDRLDADVYVELAWTNPAGAHLWQVDPDGFYVPAGAAV